MSSPPPVTTSTVTTSWSVDAVSTSSNNQSTAAWLTEHCEALDAARIEGDTLTTGWASDGQNESTETTREPGESDARFKMRHEIAFLTDMLSSPPT